MNINDYKYLWEEEKKDWVLVNTKYGYAIVNKRTQSALLIEDDNLEDEIIHRMKTAGNSIFDDINAAYADA